MKKKNVSWMGLLMGIWLIVGGQTASAEGNTMSLLEYDVQLHEDGSGTVTEYREMTMTDGTELYIEMDNLQGSEVTDFYVEGYTENPNWNSDESRETKAGEYGVIETDNGVELVWGFGEYGEKEFELTYTVTNMVRQLEDGQALNWDFNTYGDIPPETMNIIVNGPENFNSETTSIWGFGYEGTVELENGHLVSTSQQPLESESPLVILMQFTNAPFSNLMQNDQTLAEQLETSQDGASYNESDGISGGILALIIGSLIGVPVLVILFFVWIESRKKAAGKMEMGVARKRRNKGQFYTDIPYKEGEFSDIAYFLQQLQHGTFEDYFFAYLLKWSKEERINITTVEKDGWMDTEETVIQLLERHNLLFSASDSLRTSMFSQSFDSRKNQASLSDVEPQTLEEEIWSILEEIADLSGKVTESEMKKWSKKNAKSLSQLASEIKDDSKAILEERGYIKQDSVKVLGMTMPFVSALPQGDRLFDRIVQFENHLDELESDESLAYRQGLPEADYIIWATLYGKGSDLVERLEELYPEQWDEGVVQYPYFYGGFYRYSVFSQSMTAGMASGGYGAAAGAGGATSIGGGGGAIGGGGGGAR